MTTRFRDLLGTFLTCCSLAAFGLGLLLLAAEARADDPLPNGPDQGWCGGCRTDIQNACRANRWPNCENWLCAIDDEGNSDPLDCDNTCSCWEIFWEMI